jgi:hypothetical protein
MLKKSHIAIAVKRISLCFSFCISDFCIVQFDAQILLLAENFRATPGNSNEQNQKIHTDPISP